MAEGNGRDFSMEIANTQAQVNLLADEVLQLRQDCAYLPKIYELLTTVTKQWSDAALGKDQVPASTLHFVVKLLGAIIVGCLSIIFALIGVGNLGWLEFLKH